MGLLIVFSRVEGRACPGHALLYGERSLAVLGLAANIVLSLGYLVWLLVIDHLRVRDFDHLIQHLICTCTIGTVVHELLMVYVLRGVVHYRRVLSWSILLANVRHAFCICYLHQLALRITLLWWLRTIDTVDDHVLPLLDLGLNLANDTDRISKISSASRAHSG